MDAAAAQVLLELDGIFTFKEQNSTENFFDGKEVFALHLTGFGKSLVPVATWLN